MSAAAPTGLDRIWPAEPRARALATELYDSVAGLPLISVHSGLPARFLAEDLPFTDPLSLLVSHDQGVQALLRAHGIRAEFSPIGGWQTEQASRKAFVLLWRHMVEVSDRPWVQADGDEAAEAAGLPPARPGQDPEKVFDRLAARMAEHPTYPRRVLSAANVALLATSDDPASDLEAHQVLAEDPAWAGRVAPTFSPDRYLDPGHPAWRTDSVLLAEVTGIDTESLDGFLAALRARRSFFIERGTVASEHHCSDHAVARVTDRESGELYRLARSGELLPAEATALAGHLLWESGRLSAEDGLAMAIYPPAGFRSRTPGPGQARDDRGIAARVGPLLADFGSTTRFSLRLFTIDPEAYAAEILPLAVEHPALTPVPPTRFADDPAVLRALRVAGVEAVGPPRSLGIVDDMSGPFGLMTRHRLGRRLDAGALAEIVVAGRLSADQAYADLAEAVGRAPARR